MVYFKRALWFAAWVVWLSLGVGLYRELPRTLGPLVCELPLSRMERVVGFIGDGDSFLTLDSPRLSTAYRLRNARTGAVEKQIDDRRFGFGTSTAYHVPRHSLFLSVDPFQLSNVAWRMFDLADASWHTLPVHETRACVHESEPLAIGWTDRTPFARDDQPHDPGSVVVVDLKDRRRIFEWRPELRGAEKLRIVREPFFLGSGRICIPVEVNGPHAGWTLALEVWSIADDKLLARHEGLKLGYQATGTASGLAAWKNATQQNVVELVDLIQGRPLRTLPQVKISPTPGFVDGYPPLPRGGTSLNVWNVDLRIPWTSHRFSPNGRALYAPKFGGLVSLDDGRFLWRATPNELPGDARGGVFGVNEAWTVNLGFKSWTLLTKAVRSLDDGRLKYRSLTEPPTRWTNHTGTLAFVGDSSIHEFPPRVDWRLLVICQTILASPLVLLWAILKWRQRRAARRQSAEAARVSTSAQ